MTVGFSMETLVPPDKARRNVDIIVSTDCHSLQNCEFLHNKKMFKIYLARVYTICGTSPFIYCSEGIQIHYIVRIYDECEGRIEKSIPRLAE